MSRRTSLMAVSDVSSPQPTPTSLSGWPLMAPPVKPSRGLLGFLGFAPANWDRAATAPAMFWLSNEPKAPLHSDMIAILIGVPEPPLRGATAGCGAGASAGAAGAAAVLVDAAGALDELLVLSWLLDPHPAMAKAVTAMMSPSQKAPRPGCRATGMMCLLLETDTSSTDGCGLGRPPFLGDVHRQLPPPRR